MRILLLGAYGLIGSHVMACLHTNDHHVVAAGREIGGAERRFPYAQWVRCDLGDMRSEADWLPLLAGVDAVVNCVGVLQESRRDSMRAVHVDSMKALFQACIRVGIRRVVHLSAVGIQAGVLTDFARAKRDTESLLKATGLDWVILRPALVWSSTAYGGTAMLRGLAGLPFLTPIIEPNCRVQVVAVEDVAQTVLRVLEPGAPTRRTWELAHPEVHSLADIVGAIRAWLGFPTRRICCVSHVFAGVVATIADWLGHLGWRSPARTTAIRQLAANVIGDSQAWIDDLGIRPKSLAAMLAASPAGVQERWFARLYFLKPIGLSLLALFWILTGIVALGPSREDAVAVLSEAGLAPGLALAAVLIGATADVAIGIAAVFRRSMPYALTAMIALTAIYLLGGTLVRPDMWFDPLGVFLKPIPSALAAALLLAMCDER